jgi:hypothetical protein
MTNTLQQLEQEKVSLVVHPLSPPHRVTIFLLVIIASLRNCVLRFFHVRSVSTATRCFTILFLSSLLSLFFIVFA